MVQSILRNPGKNVEYDIRCRSACPTVTIGKFRRRFLGTFLGFDASIESSGSGAAAMGTRAASADIGRAASGRGHGLADSHAPAAVGIGRRCVEPSRTDGNRPMAEKPAFGPQLDL